MSRSVARLATRDALKPWEQRHAERAAAVDDRYARDPFAHLDDGHVKILDVVTLDEVTFHAYDHQREIGHAWIDVPSLLKTGIPFWRNVHEEKSRQMGITWILAWLELWATMYHEYPGLVLHLNFSEVDDGGSGSTTDSFFGKMRYIHDRLPEEFRAPVDFKYGLVRHRYRGERAYVAAEGATPDPGRGGRYKRGILDESARIPFGEAAHQALSRAIPTGRLYNSTPFGQGNVYYRLREERPAGYTFLRHHWSDHPVYGRGLHVAGMKPRSCEACAGNAKGIPWDAQHPHRAHRYVGKLVSPWYDAAVAELTDTQVAQELDIDYTASLTARVYTEFNEDVHVVDEGIPYDPKLDIDLMWDYGLDVTSVVVAQDHPHQLAVIGLLEVGDDVNGQTATPDVVSELLVEYLAELGVPMKRLTRQWTLQMTAVGDPSGEGRDLATGRPLIREYRKHGFAISAPPRYTVPQTITAAKRLLSGKPKPVRICGIKAREFARHLANNRWPTNAQGDRSINSTKPKDDIHNHACRAFAYYCAKRFPPPPVEELIGKITAGGSAPPLPGVVRRSTGKVDEGLHPDMKL